MMILLRLLLLGGVAFLAYKAWRMLRAPDTRETPAEIVQDMVKCAVCEQHVPESSAAEIDGKHYCDKHRPTDQS